MTVAPHDDDTVVLPRAVRFPVEMIPPEDFDAERLETWPRTTGRLEFVDGRLLYMPPGGDEQQDTVTDVVITLGGWVRRNPDYVLGTNEAGMRLAGATRAADAAIWKRADLGGYSGGLRRVPPRLAVEVAGDATSDTEAALREKAMWYLGVGVATVWIVLPTSKTVIVVDRAGSVSFSADAKLPAPPELPGLEPAVSELFVQISVREP